MSYFTKVFKSPFQLAAVVVLSASVLFFLGNKEKETAVPELDGLQVPEGFTIERAVDPGMISYPMFASFDSDGRLFVFVIPFLPLLNALFHLQFSSSLLLL